MPESKWEQNRHSNEEVANFLDCGDARGPAWLSTHPADREKAIGALRSRSTGDVPAPAGFLRRSL